MIDFIFLLNENERYELVAPKWEPGNFFESWAEISAAEWVHSDLQWLFDQFTFTVSYVEVGLLITLDI